MPIETSPNNGTNTLRIAMLCGVTFVVCLLTISCDDVVLLNPLPSLADDRMVGSWADSEGKLALMIRRGEGNAYRSWTAEDLKTDKTPSTYFLARTGGMLFAETSTGCDGYRFSAPDRTDAPNGCWKISRLVLSDNYLEFFDIDAMDIVRQSISGNLLSMGYRYGVRAFKGDAPSADVLLEGSSAEIAEFLAVHGKDLIYKSSAKLHRADFGRR